MAESVGDLGVVPTGQGRAFTRENAERVAAVFDCAIEGLSEREVRKTCFQAALQAIEDGSWGKVQQVANRLIGLRDGSQRSLYTVCVERKMTIRLQEMFQRELVLQLSDGEEQSIHTALRQVNWPLAASERQHANPSLESDSDEDGGVVCNFPVECLDEGQYSSEEENLWGFHPRMNDAVDNPGEHDFSLSEESRQELIEAGRLATEAYFSQEK